MRKYLGVLIGVATLCAMSWAQAPTPAPAPDQTPQAPEAKTIPTPAQKPPAPLPEYPRVEFFAGGSYAEAGLFNAGHWAGLPGWDSSLGLNVSPWFGLLVEGGQYFGTSKIPVSVPEPFPTCPPFCPQSSPTFNATTKEYNILFGAQFARRKYERWTPIAEVLYGHQGTRGVASALGKHSLRSEAAARSWLVVASTTRSPSASHYASKPTISRPAPSFRLSRRRSRTMCASP